MDSVKPNPNGHDHSILFTRQGETNTEKLLALLVCLLEAVPQLLQLITTLLHWHTPASAIALDLFGTAINVPLR